VFSYINQRTAWLTFRMETALFYYYRPVTICPTFTRLKRVRKFYFGMSLVYTTQGSLKKDLYKSWQVFSRIFAWNIWWYSIQAWFFFYTTRLCNTNICTWLKSLCIHCGFIYAFAFDSFPWIIPRHSFQGL